MSLEFQYRLHECPFCNCTNNLHPNACPPIGDAILIQCPNRECLKHYYLSWLGPWDMKEDTLKGKQRREEERRFSARILSGRKR